MAMGVLDERPVIPIIEDLGLRYIEKSLSSYNMTYLTLYSIFTADHFLTENSERYLTRAHTFFPWGTWNKDGTQLALLSYLEQAKSSMYWVGNDWAECRKNLAKWTWTCIQNDEFRETLGGVPAFYHTTPIGTLIRLMGNKHRDALGRFLNHVETFGPPKKPFFALIHHMSPHAPYMFSETCEQLVANQIDAKKGYRDNYHCALIRVDEFMKKINILDPDAIVVIQADHGTPASGDFDTAKIDDPEIVRARGRIFNAIKAPNSCFEKYGEPKTNVNSVRFVLNCAYGFELPFRKDIHYMGYYESNPKMFGNVFEKEIY